MLIYDFNICTCNLFFWIAMKQENCRTFKPALFKKLFITHIQIRSPEKLLCTAAPIMILSFVIYRITARINTYLDIILAILYQQIHIYNNAKDISYFIRYIFKQLFTIWYPDYSAVIIGSNILYLATMNIYETTNPFQIFITP